PTLPLCHSPTLRLEAWLSLFAAMLLIGSMASAQQVSNLEPERPISIEDARVVPYRALSGAVDWAYTERRDGLNDYGPGFSVLYGALGGLEIGGSLRYVPRPGRNAGRGISSGDLFLHGLYAIRPESATWPALAVRADVQLPTGLRSKGTDVHLTGIATRSLESVRLHANVRFTYLGATAPLQRSERYEAIAGIDFFVSRRGLTDTLAVADVAVRTNPVVGGLAVVTVEVGARRRIGSQTVFFAGAGSDLTGPNDRTKIRARIGVS